MKRIRVDTLQVVRLLFILGVLFVAVMVVYFPTYSRYRKLKEENAAVALRIEALQREIKDLEKNISALDQNPFLMEKIARETIGVARDNEIVVDIQE